MVNNQVFLSGLYAQLLRRSVQARLFVCLGAAGLCVVATQTLGQSSQQKAIEIRSEPATLAPARPIAAPETRQAGSPTSRPKAAAPGALAPQVPRGYRAISLQTTDEIAVAGLIRPGDRVDIQLVLRGDALGTGPVPGAGNEARALIQNVMVLAVGNSIANSKGGSGGDDTTAARTVTLALQPNDVATFTLARSLGSLFLALRNPEEDALASGTTVMLGDIRGAGARSTTPPRRARMTAPGHSIELVIGGETRTISVGGGS